MKDVTASEIGDPGDIVKRGKKERIGLTLRKLRAHVRDFFGSRFLSCCKRPNGSFRTPGAVRPELIDKIARINDADAAVRDRVFKKPEAFSRYRAAVKSDRGILRQVFCQPHAHVRHISRTAFHHGDAGRFGFFGGLLPVAAVGPQKRFFCGDNQRSG